MLGTSCAKDIDSNCRGVSPDPTRLKDCLNRNQDVLSPQCRNAYGPAFDAIQKRVAARSAVAKLCARDVAKFCGGVQKGDSGKALECLLAGPRGVCSPMVDLLDRIRPAGARRDGSRDPRSRGAQHGHANRSTNDLMKR